MKIFRILYKQSRHFHSKVDYYSQFNPSPLSMQQFTDFGRSASNRESFLFLRKELPVRLANIMKEFSFLPDDLRALHSVEEVAQLYRQSFEDLLKYETHDGENQQCLDNFTESLIKVRNRHKDVVLMTAQGVMELKESHQSVNSNVESNIQYFLDRFYMSRISIRMLINQHTLLFGDSPNSTHNHIGCIDPNCDVIKVIEDAYYNARFLCDQYYLASPELVMKHHNERERKSTIVKEESQQAKMSPVRVVYVPSHLYHILFELFKNAMRAVVEHHKTDDSLPPLEILVVMGEEDLTIKLSDQGGGIPRSLMDLLFNYMYSTAPQPASAGEETPPLAGYGYGLPLSRLYARYFHGDLQLTSYAGYGTDAVIFLKAISSEANELLPVYNKTCQRQYENPLQTHDWSSQNSSTSMTVRHFSSSRRTS